MFSLFSALATDFFYEDFDKAKSAESFIRFDMESTKIGLFTTGFSGVVKKFTINRDQATTLTFKVVDMDTDIDSRNDKMWEQSFDYKNHPEIKVEIQDAPVVGENTMKAKIYLRGYTKEFPLKVLVTKTENGLLAKGSAVLKISELEIPDPSIAIAKVRDEINLEFSFLLK
jgi:hypothetical protein